MEDFRLHPIIKSSYYNNLYRSFGISPSTHRSCPCRFVSFVSNSRNFKYRFDREGIYFFTNFSTNAPPPAGPHGADPDRIANLVFLHERIDRKVAVGFELLDKIEQAAVENRARLIVIDNISKLLPDSLKAETVTMVITALNRIREKTGASFLVIGHTTKGQTETAILPTSYYGSSMVQNFFTEIFYLDTTKDGKFFLSHAKTKREECYSQTVPVFTRGEHPRLGVGFTYESLQAVADIQLPLSAGTEKTHKRTDLNNFRYELELLSRNGVKYSRIAELCGVGRTTVYRFFGASDT